VLQRLDRLTLEESKTTVAQTLDVVYGLVNNMQVVMEGAHRQFVRARSWYETPFWQMARLRPMISDKPLVRLADLPNQISPITCPLVLMQELVDKVNKFERS
jgi:hypothetical protein